MNAERPRWCPRTWWAIGYIAVNLIAALVVVSTGQLLGDFAGEQPRLMEEFIVTAALVCASISLLLILFNLAVRVSFGTRPLEFDREKLGVIIAIALVGFIFYVQYTGLFIAGSAERGGSLTSAFWVLLNIDALFIIYYGSCRESKYFKLNLLLWVLSFIQRGWFAFLFFVVALESFRAIRKRQVTTGKLALVILFLASYPILDLAKIYVRVSEFVEPSMAMSYIAEGLAASGFKLTESLADSTEKIIARLQVVSHAQAIADNAPYFQQLVSNGGITPFWKEGVLGIILDRQLGNQHPPETPQALASFIAPALDSSWNVNPSLVGWLIVHAESFPATLLFLAWLGALSIFFAQLIDQNASFRDMVWFIWLVFLVPGWIAQFVSFVLALATFYFLASLTRLRWLPAPRSLHRPARPPGEPR